MGWEISSRGIDEGEKRELLLFYPIAGDTLRGLPEYKMMRRRSGEEDRKELIGKLRFGIAAMIRVGGNSRQSVGKYIDWALADERVVQRTGEGTYNVDGQR